MTNKDQYATVAMGRPVPSGLPAYDERARWDAEVAARAAGVHIREIAAPEQIEAVGQLFSRIWVREGPSAVGNELLRAFVKTGNYVVGAFEGGTLVGACVGFFSAPPDSTLHSHIAGVSPAVRSRSVGYALKLHQRAWAMRRGVRVIAWTFDPLVSRNAYFNIVKLGARPVEYLPNFYGGMQDGINDGDDSDRLLVHWQLGSPEVTQSCAGRREPPDAVGEEESSIGLCSSASGAPLAGALDGPVCLVAVPPDIEAVRHADPSLGREWRAAVRETLTTLMSDGAQITGFDRSGCYVVRRTSSPPPRQHDGQGTRR